MDECVVEAEAVERFVRAAGGLGLPDGGDAGVFEHESLVPSGRCS